MRLFVFDHCPFCVRALLAVGLKSLPVEISYILEDDIETPTKMIGKQMVPILEYEAGKFMPESLDIVKYLDANFGDAIFTEAQNPEVSAWIDDNFGRVNEYVMPRFAEMNFPEFETASARNMYITRHEERLEQSFAELLAKSASYKAAMETELEKLAEFVDLARVQNQKYSLDDIILFPLLRALTCVKGLAFPKAVKEYTEILAKQGNVPLFYDQAC
ncbi:MAG: glutaredoxin 2 [Wohlfahrtiimonas sp.]